MFLGLEITNVQRFYAFYYHIKINGDIYDVIALKNFCTVSIMKSQEQPSVPDFKCPEDMTPCTLHLNTSLQDNPYLHGRSE
jgi:hypothetical protein